MSSEFKVLVGGAQGKPGQMLAVSSITARNNVRRVAGMLVNVVSGDANAGVYELASDLTTWNRQNKGVFDPRRFGAVPGTSEANAATNLAAFQEAIDAADAEGGVVEWGDDDYVIGGTLTVNGEGTTLRGYTVSEQWFPDNWTSRSASLIFSHTSGPCIRAKKSAFSAENFRITCTDTRAAAAAGSNYGIRIEAEDTNDSANRVNFPTLRNVQVIRNPNHNIVLAGDSVGALFEQVVAEKSGYGHGFAIDRGDHTGRTNVTQGGSSIKPGIITMTNCRANDNAGHGMALGHPNNGSNMPYRAHITNLETYRNGVDPVVGDGHPLHDTAECFIRAENVTLDTSACAGYSAAAANARSCLSMQGRDIVLRNCRYISSASPCILLRSNTPATRGVVIENASVQGGSVPAYFLAAQDAGCRDVIIRIPWSSQVGAVLDTAVAITGYRLEIENAVTESRPTTYTGLLTATNFEVTGTLTLTGSLNATAGQFVFTGNDTDVDFNANDTNTNGQIVVLQSGSGDPGMRFTVGGANINWIVGADNSISDRFGIQCASSLDSGAPFYITTDNAVNVAGTFNVTAATTFSGPVETIVTDTNINGQQVIRQYGAGDATIRFVLGNPTVTTWSVGIDNSVDDQFAIQPNSGLNSSAPFRIRPGGSVAAGIGGLATDATAGFFYAAATTGTPSGVPETITGYAPLLADTASGRLWLYNSGWQPFNSVLTVTWVELLLMTASLYSGREVIVTDIGTGRSRWSSNGTTWEPMHSILLAKGSAQVIHTGTTAETTVASYALPASLLGLGRKIVSQGVLSMPASANAKTVRHRFGASAGAGTIFTSVASSGTTQSMGVGSYLRNRNSATSQIGASNGLNGNNGASAGTVVTSSIDTTAISYLSITVELANSSETVNLESYDIFMFA